MSHLDLPHELIDAWRQPAWPADRPPARPRAARTPVAPPVTVGTDPGGPRSDLLSTLSRRRSTRHFAEDPVDAGTLMTLLAEAYADERAMRDGDGPELAELETTAFAIRVHGLAPATYDLDHRARQATPLAPLPPGERLRSLTLQAEFVDAAVVLSLSADLAATDAHGYRELMVRASATAYHLWLAAVARGWTGSVFAGLLPAALRGPLGNDGASRAQLFALALGHPRRDLTAPPGPPSPTGDRATHDPTTPREEDR
jgi:hypothetical protein